MSSSTPNIARRMSADVRQISGRGPYSPVVVDSKRAADHTPPADPIVFGAPPAARPGTSNNSKWLPVVSALKGRPGEWAKITTAKFVAEASNLRAEIRRGAGNWRDGPFEATTRGCDVYARFIGESS